MLLGDLLMLGYSIVNTIWVGHTLGGRALGAVAISATIFNVLVSLASGAAMTGTVLVSRFYGAKDYEMVQKVFNTLFWLTGCLSLFVSGIGVIFSDTILRWMGTPAPLLGLASSYLKLTLSGCIFIYLYMLFLSVLRGIGDTVTPMVLLGISTLLNAVLDPLLILGIGPFPKLGLNGSAVASLIAQGTVFIVGLVYINARISICRINLAQFTVNRFILLQSVKIGLPYMLQRALNTIGSAVVTSFVNACGPAAIAAFGAGMRIDLLNMMPSSSVGMAAATITGQNLGSGKPERVQAVFLWGITIGVIYNVILSLVVFFAPKLILRIFVQEAAVIDVGVSYLRTVGCGYILIALLWVSNGVINGSGRTLVTTIITILSLWAIRVPLAGLLGRSALGYQGIWLAIVASNAINVLLNLAYYFWGNIKYFRAPVKGLAANEILGNKTK